MGGLEKLTPFKHLVIFAVSMLDFSGINVSGPQSCFFLQPARDFGKFPTSASTTKCFFPGILANS